MQPTYQRQSKTKLIATIVAIIVIAGVVVIADHLKSNNQTAATLTPTTSGMTAPAANPPASSSGVSKVQPSTSYKDGTYSASSDYYVPHGYENIKVSVTLKDGAITSSSVTNSESDPTSAHFQEDFASVYKNYVVGKKMSDLRLGVVAGASDTTQGFNEALQKIASEAQA